MCELLAVVWPQPEPFNRVLPWACGVEQFGIAGFGWGVAWVEDGRVRGYRNPGRLSADPDVAERLGQIRSRAFLIHLRRPSMLSTIELADTQPFVQEAGAFAFCHNGLFTADDSFRARFAGRLGGRADSEVGFRLCEDLLAEGFAPEEALTLAHRELGGPANLGYLDADGSVVVYSAHERNPVWSFREDGAQVVSTRLHSLDESVFDLIFRTAQDRRLADGVVVRIGNTEKTEWNSLRVGSALL